jgi:hypothetical protein
VGYIVSSAFSVSPNDTHSYFVYFIPGRSLATEWINDWVHNNFARIAKVIGKNGVIIVPHKTANWDPEEGGYVAYALFERFDPNRRDDDCYDEIDFSFLQTNMPILIISRRPLEKGKKASDAIALNLLGFRDTRDLTEAPDIIISGIQQDDWNYILERFPARESDKPEYKNWVDRLKMINNIVQIKPTLFGMGVNVNAAIDAAGNALAKGHLDANARFFRLTNSELEGPLPGPWEG